jgi:hypothetical protein
VLSIEQVGKVFIAMAFLVATGTYESWAISAIASCSTFSATPRRLSASGSLRAVC